MDEQAEQARQLAAECERLHARVAELEAPRLFPVCDAGFSIPWSLAERAWEQYAKKGGSGQPLETVARRGGFYVEELDQFVPGWREEVRETNVLRAENERLRARITAMETVISSQARQFAALEAQAGAAILSAYPEFRAAALAEEAQTGDDEAHRRAWDRYLAAKRSLIAAGEER